MKWLLLLCILIPSLAIATVLKPLTCSINGTDVILINGVNWSEKAVANILDRNLEPFVLKSHIDKKFPAEQNVKFRYSYNSARGLVPDFIESYSQKINDTFGVPKDVAFVYAYFAFQRSPLNPSFVDAILATTQLRFSDALAYINEAHSSEYQDRMQREYNIFLEDSENLKNKSQNHY